MNKLLYQFSGVAGIFFPVGKPEDDGTCEFASNKCLLACAAINCNPKKGFKQIRNPDNGSTIQCEEGIEKIGHEKKKELYDFIIEKPVFQVCDRIMHELAEMKCNILYWFACGDCMKKDEARILKIIEYLDNEGVIQCGFTRNKTFWEESVKYTNYIALTLESYWEVLKSQTMGLFAVPDYKNNTVKIYKGQETYWICGGNFTYLKLRVNTIKSNCLECFNKKEGCFTKYSK